MLSDIFATHPGLEFDVPFGVHLNFILSTSILGALFCGAGFASFRLAGILHAGDILSLSLIL